MSDIINWYGYKIISERRPDWSHDTRVKSTVDGDRGDDENVGDSDAVKTIIHFKESYYADYVE